jgi:hypothetical protein
MLVEDLIRHLQQHHPKCPVVIEGEATCRPQFILAGTEQVYVGPVPTDLSNPEYFREVDVVRIVPGN